jgi:nucleoside-diphosphate-sugar epimerase
LITGAAGGLGQKICEHLAGQGKNIIGLYRNRLPKAHKNMLPLCCDLNAAESIVAPLKSTDTVIHLAWQGGVLGSCAKNGMDTTDEGIKAAENVLLTRNIVRAMERANAQKIIFLSWVGVDRRADKVMLREKYWAENLIINSTIPEKIIIRAGVIGTGQIDGELYRAAGILAKIPLILPLPRKMEGIVLTTIKDLLWAIDQALTTKPGKDSGCRIIDLTSTSPSSGSKVLEAMDTKAWGHRRLFLRGIIGNALFRLTEKKFGAARPGEATVSDYFAASTMYSKPAAEGLPPTSLGSAQGHKTDLINAL